MKGSNFWGGNDVVRRLAVGFMTEVLLARSAEPNGGSRLAAVKCVARGCMDEPLVESLFAREATLAARLSHPNVVSVLEVCRDRAYHDIGDGADDFLAALERAQPRSAAYHARQILAFRERYQTNDVLAAMDHARQYGAFEYRAIERILVARAAPRWLDEYVAEATEKKLAAIVRQRRSEPRDLSDCDARPRSSVARSVIR